MIQLLISIYKNIIKAPNYYTFHKLLVNRYERVNIMCNNSEGTNSIAEILEVICVLQQNASCPLNSIDTCDRPVLGCGEISCICNTRPVVLYLCGSSTSLSMPTVKTASDDEVLSNVFRVEKVENNCATFRVLAENTDATSIYPYVSTNSFFTLNLNCLCVLRCLNDTCVECL